MPVVGAVRTVGPRRRRIAQAGMNVLNMLTPRAQRQLHEATMLPSCTAGKGDARPCTFMPRFLERSHSNMSSTLTLSAAAHSFSGPFRPSLLHSSHAGSTPASTTYLFRH